MSVCFILSCSGGGTNDFYLPVATERVFQEEWLPIIKALDLPWAKQFQYGIEFEQKDFEAVRKELLDIKAWVVKRSKGAMGMQMTERIDMICEKLTEQQDSRKAERIAFIG